MGQRGSWPLSEHIFKALREVPWVGDGSNMNYKGHCLIKKKLLIFKKGRVGLLTSVQFLTRFLVRKLKFRK